jgi:hypothetical protein
MTFLAFGIDYGTSASKVVVRDEEAAGGTRSHALQWSSTADDPYRIPSDIAVHDKKVWCGFPRGHVGDGWNGGPPADAIWFTSLKMKVADAFRANGGDAESVTGLPGGWTRRDLLVVGLVWLIRRARGKALAATSRRQEDIQFGTMFGIPHDFRQTDAVKVGFLHLFRSARALVDHPRLFRDFGEKSDWDVLSPNALSFIREAWGHSVTLGVGDIDWWHLSEARASAAWAWNSPAFGEGAYFHVDIGAGTTNVVAYLVAASWGRNRRWVRDRITIFGAMSNELGMDRLQGVLEAGAIASSISELEKPYRQAWFEVHERASSTPGWRSQWGSARVLPLGGGSARGELVERYTFHPFDPGVGLELCETPRVPEDLDMGLVLPARAHTPATVAVARRTLTVAYGLAASLTDRAFGESEAGILATVPDRLGTSELRTLAGIYEK